MKEIIEEILGVAVSAPSGDNMQPWRFIARGNNIDVLNVPERDQTLYNFRQHGSLVAHGAFIENIDVAALAAGYNARIELFPDRNAPELIARVTLEHGAQKDDTFLPALRQRATNRKPYLVEPLPEAARRDIAAATDGLGGSTIILVENAERKKQLAAAASVNERILFENRALHSSFFKHIVWTEKEEKMKQSGLYLKTLELPPPAEAAFRLFRYWPLLQLFNLLGLSYSVAKTNAAIYASASAVGAVIMPSDRVEDFVLTGRIMQRIWLRATARGLAMQVIAGLLYLAQRVGAGEARMFSPVHQARISEAHRTINEVLGVENGLVTLLFRLGRAEPPSARSSRLPPEITFIV